MTLPYRRSARADRCRWPSPDENGYCRSCGWPLTRVRSYSVPDGPVTGHYRHRYPRETGTKLTLSEVVPAAARSAKPNRTRCAQGTYPHEVDSNRAFVKKGGAGGRLAIPTVDEWLAWKAAVA